MGPYTTGLISISLAFWGSKEAQNASDIGRWIPKTRLHRHLLYTSIDMTTDKSYSTCWVGTNLGILKTVDIQKSTFENYFYAGEELSTVDTRLAISKLTWGDDTDRLFVGLSNGVLREFDTSSRVFTRQCSVTDNKSPMIGLHYHNNTVINCTQLGLLSMWPFDGDSLTVNVGKVACMTGQPNSFVVATGGEENDLKIWDLSVHKGDTTQPIFKARNVRKDRLYLRNPIYITGVDFKPKTGGKVLVTTTRSSQVRQYDTRVQRRPVSDWKYGEYPITCISVQDGFIIIGNSIGTVSIIDSRTWRLCGNLKGSTGAVRDVSFNAGYIGVCGVDRFTRVYSARDRKLVNKVYTKLESTCILLDPQGVEKLKDKDISVDRDELWDEIQPPTKRARET